MKIEYCSLGPAGNTHLVSLFFRIFEINSSIIIWPADKYTSFGVSKIFALILEEGWLYNSSTGVLQNSNNLSRLIVEVICDHPFIAPAVRPLINCLENIKYRIIIGNAAKLSTLKILVQFAENSPNNKDTPS